MKNTPKTQGNEKHWVRLGRSVLNGVIGDYLEKDTNPLAIQIGFYHHYKRLKLDKTLANQLQFPITNKVVVLVHGLTNSESVWDFSGPAVQPEGLKENYGTFLQKEFSYTPFYLRYNTGLSLEENGKLFAQQLTELFEAYPLQISELLLVGFSMGGLLLRYAQHTAMQTDMVWLNSLTKCMYLGTPHEGSPLEKFGYYSGEIVRRIPKTYVNHWADLIDIRSQGIKDLKDGLKFLSPTNEEDATCSSFFEGARHYFISGSVSKQEDSVFSKLFGDSLVRQESARPVSAPDDSLEAHFDGIPHIPLSHSRRVYRQMAKWVAEDQENFIELGESKAEEMIQLELDDNLADPIDLPEEDSNQGLLTGSIDLLNAAYETTVDTVETVHDAIAAEPFKVLDKVPLIGQISKPVSDSHRSISDLVFRSLRSGGKFVHKTAKGTANIKDKE